MNRSGTALKYRYGVISDGGKQFFCHRLLLTGEKVLAVFIRILVIRLNRPSYLLKNIHRQAGVHLHNIEGNCPSFAVLPHLGNLRA